jgi:signal transduction histidine kinase
MRQHASKNITKNRVAMTKSEAAAPGRKAAKKGMPLPSLAAIKEAMREPERLRALRRTDLLGSSPESAFERITRLAAGLLGVPAAFVSLIDAEGDWHKGAVGLDGKLPAERRDTGRSLCQVALLSDMPLLIEDIEQDERYSDLESVKSLGLRAYAGAPLIVDGMHAIGTLCAVDFVAHPWSARDAEVLAELARSITREIELRTVMMDAVASLELTQRLLRERDEAVSHLAHDLRSPLSAISISAVGLSRRPEPEIKNYAGIQTRAAKQMSELIEQMRASVSGLPMPAAQARVAVRCDTLLADVRHAMSEAADGRGILLTVENTQGLPAISINYPQVMRVFANLVGNSIAYSPKGTVVTLSAEREGEFVRFCIADQGPGIPEEYHDRVFDRHWQVERGLSKGHGLGLAVARLFVEANGGVISISEGKGGALAAGKVAGADPLAALGELGDPAKLPSLEDLAAAEEEEQGPGVGAILHFTLPVARVAA